MNKLEKNKAIKKGMKNNKRIKPLPPYLKGGVKL